MPKSDETDFSPELVIRPSIDMWFPLAYFGSILGRGMGVGEIIYRLI
jgi:hypothetical protein